MIQAVIFDMDGVLIDTEKYLVKYWCKAAADFGFDMKEEHALLIRSLAAEYAQPLLQGILGETFDYQAVRARRKEYMTKALSIQGIEKKAGADFILEELSKRGIKAAVATATDEERAKKYLMQIGLYDKFDRILCAAMVEHGKPMPDIYEYAVNELGEKKENCLAVEDSPNGVRSAARAGLKTIMVPDLTQPDEELRTLLFGVADSLKDLIHYL